MEDESITSKSSVTLNGDSLIGRSMLQGEDSANPSASATKLEMNCPVDVFTASKVTHTTPEQAILQAGLLNHNLGKITV